jgi:hypothetical protein
MLMSSLPFHGRLFERTRTPLSRPALERRLGLLEPGDRALLAEVERVVQWDAIDTRADDAEMVARAGEVLGRLRQAGTGDLHDAVRHRLEMRTAVAALRRRRMGLGPPAPAEGPWGVGRWTERIAARWAEPDLGLARAFPWIARAGELIAADEPLALERLLLGRAWEDIARRGADHRFDLTAVVLYVLRWNIVDRWTRMDAREAAERFDALLAEGLGAFADPLAGEARHG